MGCFLSTTTKKTTPNSNTKLQTTTAHRFPPLTLPFLEEKEEVKEILSEIPIIINNPINHSTNEKNNIPKTILSPEKKQCHDIHDSHVYKIARIFNPRELSGNIRVGSGQNETAKELSRHIRVGSGRIEMMVEHSKSIRVGSDPKETNRQRSPAKYRNTSPARRSDHLSGSGQIRNTSPARKSGQLFGSCQTRNISPDRFGSGRTTGGLPKKDNGENSCRRSRSPPIMCGDQFNGGTKNSISRCSSTRKTGKSPGRVRSELADRRRNPAPEAENGSRSNRENNSYKKSDLTSGINESIDNPLVSLECFIFI